MNSVHFMIQDLSAVIWDLAVKHWVIVVQVRKCGLENVQYMDFLMHKKWFLKSRMENFSDGHYLKVIWNSFGHYLFLN